jgi:type I restriction enzyme S subunit
VEWLGEVPAHWEMKKLRFLGEARNGLTYSPEDIVDEGEGTLVLRSSNVQNMKIAFGDNVYVNKQIPKRIITRLNDILICSRNGSRALIGKNALIEENAAGLAYGAFMMVFRSEVNPYLFWVLNSQLFEYQSGSFLTSTINQLTVENINGFEIPLPPVEERSAIIAYAKEQTSKIDVLIGQVESSLALIHERRAALISAAVTGKIDVRDWQAAA